MKIANKEDSTLENDLKGLAILDSLKLLATLFKELMICIYKIDIYKKYTKI
jgi:hypothetical protein